jgi:hypothetical protein
MEIRIVKVVTIVASIVMGLTSCADYSRPERLPKDEISFTAQNVSGETKYGNTPVQFFFDNTEAFYDIEKNDNVTPKFISAMLGTSLMTTGEYALRPSGDSYEFYNLKDDKNELNRLLDNAFKDDSFYILNSTEEQRKNFGIIKELYTTDNSVLDMNNVNVILTDFSESDIDKTAQIIREKYLVNGDYSACVLAISLAMRSDSPVPFYIWDTSGAVLPVSTDIIPDIGERSFYLFMTGPTPSLSAYVTSLKQGLENVGLTDAGDELALKAGEYNISEFNYLDFAFSTKKNLETEKTLIGNNSDKSGNEAFENCTVRLTQDVDNLDIPDDVAHFIYNKDADGGMGKVGYNGSKTFDFSLNVDAKINIKDHNVEYIDLDEDGNVVDAEGNVIDDLSAYDSMSEDSSANSSSGDRPEEELSDVYYTLGDVEIMYACNSKWLRMDPKRIRRFFKKVETKGSRLSVISDNTDEEGIRELYITVPVYEVTTVKNYPGNWIEARSSDNDQAITGTSWYRKTRSFRYFYSNLFALDSVNKDGMILGTETKVEKSKVGYMKILISMKSD